LKLSFSEIADRITGFSTPIFGISWNPPVLDADVAKRQIAFLEDRRALYNLYELETPMPVIAAISPIRERLTRDLEQLDRSSLLAVSIAAMRAACRKFMDSVGRSRYDSMTLGPNMVLFSAVGELRGVFGIHIARICVQHGVGIESDLAAILPTIPDGPAPMPKSLGPRTKKKR
jgi:hypothetical protein